MQEIRIIYTNLAGGLMVSLFSSSVIYYGFESRSGQTKDYQICIICFSTKLTSLSSKRQDWKTLRLRNVDNMSEWIEMYYTDGLLFQLASNIKIQLSVLV
jgi:hypothetical protein